VLHFRRPSVLGRRPLRVLHRGRLFLRPTRPAFLSDASRAQDRFHFRRRHRQQIRAEQARQMTSTTSSEIPSHLSAADKRALNAALTALLRGPDKVRAEQIRDKIKEDGWFPAAASAAHICQRQSLGLRPWESPPCSCPRPNNSPQGRL